MGCSYGKLTGFLSISIILDDLNRRGIYTTLYEGWFL
jgi:hypothetical protein